jgi:uncharacterized protein YceH (UPF0502 family)
MRPLQTKLSHYHVWTFPAADISGSIAPKLHAHLHKDLRMSSETSTPALSKSPEWSILGMAERRVLGVLVEKAKTTPDTYPMSLNALTTGCNQKSNRDPLLNLSEEEVEETLLGLNKHGLVSKITGGRVERWRHMLYESWQADKVELAVLAELLLRGPQTEGELRGRASRMEPIDDLAALRDVLHKLVDRRLVVYLTPEGKRGTILSHGFHSPEELDAFRKNHPQEADDSPRPTAPRGSTQPNASPDIIATLQESLADAHKEIADLRAQIVDLHGKISQLTAQMQELRETLGA